MTEISSFDVTRVSKESEKKKAKGYLARDNNENAKKEKKRHDSFVSINILKHVSVKNLIHEGKIALMNDFLEYLDAFHLTTKEKKNMCGAKCLHYFGELKGLGKKIAKTSNWL